MTYKLDLLIDEGYSNNKIDFKTIYNTDNITSLSDWLRIDKIKLINDALPTTNGLNLPLKILKLKQPNDFIGYLHDHSNNVQYNTKGVGIYSTIFSGEHGLYVTKNNFYRVICGFSSRRLIQSNWINQKDEYLKPNEIDERFKNFYYDSIIYSLFNNSSFQTSIKNINYNDNVWNIKNEFFWMSVDQMKELSDENGYDELYNDARTASDRHVYKLLFGEERIYDKLSPDAKSVLDRATELVEMSIEMRQVMSNEENHLDSWDAGYAQLKLVWKEYFPEQFKEFRQLYKNMEDRMRPLVYELGFLMK